MKMIKERADILAIFLGEKDVNTNAYCWRAQLMARGNEEDQKHLVQ